MAKGKTVRFAQLVKAAGKPHPATLWTDDPDQDPEFRKAIKENRVVSVHMVNVGTKKESGEIGFVKGSGFSYLIFPKALPFAEGVKVIGLKFEMLEDAPVKDPVKVKEARRTSKVERVKTAKEEPEAKEEKEEPTAKEAEPTFKVTVQFTAKATRDLEVQAKTATGAIEAALKEAKSIEPEDVKWETEALEVRKTK